MMVCSKSDLRDTSRERKMKPPAGMYLRLGKNRLLGSNMLGRAAYVMALVCLIASPAVALVAQRQTTLDSPTPDEGAYFGSSVSLNGSGLLVGAPNDDNDPNLHTTFSGSGAAYVYQQLSNNHYDTGQKLLPSDLLQTDEYGTSVSLLGDIALIGAPGHGYGHNYLPYGTAYVYQRAADGQWNQAAKFQATDYNAQQRRFGQSVALSGTNALIGAPHIDGAAYIFSQGASGAWTQSAELFPADVHQYSDNFGDSVALQGNRALIGAPDRNVNGLSSSGAAYVFEQVNGTWMQTAKLVPDDPKQDDDFGANVSMFGDFAMVSAPRRNNAAYIFERAGSGSWSEVAKLTGAGGGSIAIGSNLAMIGAPNYVSSGVTVGSAYFFQRDASGNWTKTGQIIGGPTYTEDLGNSLSLDGSSVAIGDGFGEFGGDGLYEEGIAYVYTIDANGLPGDFNRDGVVDAADYVLWRNEKSKQTSSVADANGDSVANTLDYNIWRANFGATRATMTATAVPEPATYLSVCIALSGAGVTSLRTGRRSLV
jgi:hypothetical protein